jgi:hypothetical protein
MVYAPNLWHSYFESDMIRAVNTLKSMTDGCDDHWDQTHTFNDENPYVRYHQKKTSIWSIYKPLKLPKEIDCLMRSSHSIKIKM